MANPQISVVRILALCAISLGFALVAFGLYKNDLVYANVSRFFKASTHLKLDLTTLRGGETVEEVKRRFPELDWYCGPNTSATQFGDFFCADDHLETWNGQPAMLTVFWFKNGKLANLKIDIPREKHKYVKAYLLRQLGRPDGWGRRDLGQADLVIWKLETKSALFFNIDPEPNPLAWSTVLWSGPDQVAQMGDIIDRTNGKDPNYGLAEDVARKVIRHLSTR